MGQFTIKNKNQLFKYANKKQIYLWTGIGFLAVTKKALKDMLSHKTSIRCTCELGDTFIRIGF